MKEINKSKIHRSGRMKNSQGRKAIIMKTVMIILCLTFFGTSLSSCQTIRRKFTRKKKKKTQAVIPVLNPETYPETIYNPEEKYRSYYGLWRIWQKDFLKVIGEKGTKKRLRYLIVKMIQQVQGMQSQLDEVKREEMAAIAQDLESVQAQLQGSPSLRNDFTIKKTIVRADREIRNKFKVEHVQNHLSLRPSL